MTRKTATLAPISIPLAPTSANMGRMFAIVTALLLAVVALISAPASAAQRDRVEAFLQVTGFDVALDSIALTASAAPAMLGLQEEDFGLQWQALSEDVFDTGDMRERALDILEATLEDDMLAHAAAFYASDLGQRLVEVENEAHLADDDEKDAQGDALLAALQASDDPRIALFERMGHAIDPNDIGSQAMTEIQVRFILAASYAGVIALRTDEDGLRAILAENAKEMEADLTRSALASAAYTYQDFSLEELTEYTEALENPSMMTVYELMNAVHFSVMSDRFEALALRMGELQPAQDL